MSQVKGAEDRGGYAELVSSLVAGRPGITVERSGVWLRVTPPGARPRTQGWKLHLTATVASAEEVLSRAVPVLLEAETGFKLAATPDLLAALNAGELGGTQVGKFVTVYPDDDETAVTVARRLDEATHGLLGPAVPTDRRLRPGGPVHYRYGGFDQVFFQEPLGRVLPALVAPDGELVPDEREHRYVPPTWAADPFVAAGLTDDGADAAVTMVARRFLIVAPIAISSRSRVSLAVDVEERGTCVVKQVDRWGEDRSEGDGPLARLERESEVLSLLGEDPRFPAVLALAADAGNHYLVLEDLGGRSLQAAVSAAGGQVDVATACAWGVELTELLETVHATGFAYRDVKPKNVLVRDDGRLALVDFDLAHPFGDPSPAPGWGTPGYTSPQQAAGDPPAVADDVYGLGALLLYLLTGADPSQAPNRARPLERPLGLLRPGLPDSIAQLVARCLDADAANRPATLDEVREALAPPAPGKPASPRRRPPSWESIGARLTASLQAEAQPLPDRPGLTWLSRHPLAQGAWSRDLNMGTAGALLALTEAAACDPRLVDRDVIAQGARGLAHAPRPGGPPLPGLLVGEGGIALALLRAGLVLGDDALVEEAARRSRWIATLPHGSPDLFNGTAGRIVLHLNVHSVTGASVDLETVRAGADALVVASEPAGRTGTGTRWRIPEGYAGLSGVAQPGYAHGAAGIADVLLAVHVATGEPAPLATALAAARWLEELAVPSEEHGGTVDWPMEEGQPITAPFWCHGATGIGRLFLRLAQVTGDADALETATRAARSVSRRARWAGPTLCHGLAGNLELLLEVSAAIGSGEMRAEAEELGALLSAFLVEEGDRLVALGDTAAISSPDYLIGYAGIAVSFLRLAQEDLSPSFFSGLGLPWDSPRMGERRASSRGGSDGGRRSRRPADGGGEDPEPDRRGRDVPAGGVR